jgi:putative phage-type endonuclease
VTAAVRTRRTTPTAVRVLPADAGRAEWLAARRGRLCSSDLPPLLGLSSFGTPASVYYDKRGQLGDDRAGEAALWGSLLEEPVAREWARRNRATVRRVGLVEHLSRRWQGATLDRQVADCPTGEPGGCFLEVKCRSAFKADRWRRAVPDDVLAQVLWALSTTGYGHAHVAVLIGGNDYRQITVRPDVRLMADLVAAGERFWTDHVLSGRPPAASGAADADLYDDLYPDRTGIVRLDRDDAIDAIEALTGYRDAGDAERLAKRDKDTARAELVRLLGAGDTAVIDDDVRWTYTASERVSIDAAALAERYPEAYAATASTTTVRTLRLPRARRQETPR